MAASPRFASTPGGTKIGSVWRKNSAHHLATQATGASSGADPTQPPTPTHRPGTRGNSAANRTHPRATSPQVRMSVRPCYRRCESSTAAVLIKSANGEKMEDGCIGVPVNRGPSGRDGDGRSNSPLPFVQTRIAFRRVFHRGVAIAEWRTAATKKPPRVRAATRPATPAVMRSPPRRARRRRSSSGRT